MLKKRKPFSKTVNRLSLQATNRNKSGMDVMTVRTPNTLHSPSSCTTARYSTVMQVPFSKASNPLNLLHSQQHIQKLSANLQKAFITLPCFLLHLLTPTLGVNINVLLTRRLALTSAPQRLKRCMFYFLLVSGCLVDPSPPMCSLEVEGLAGQH